MKASTFLTATVIAASVAIYFMPPPTGVSADTMHAAALVVFTVGLWAVGALPEHVVALLFFTLAMALAVAPAQVVFSGFVSATLWLVLGGLVMAEAVVDGNTDVRRPHRWRRNSECSGCRCRK